MVQREVRKQISLFLPVSDWRRLRLEAAQQGVPITELCRRWMIPELDRLRLTSPANYEESTATGTRTGVSQ